MCVIEVAAVLIAFDGKMAGARVLLIEGELSPLACLATGNAQMRPRVVGGGYRTSRPSAFLEIRIVTMHPNSLQQHTPND